MHLLSHAPSNPPSLSLNFSIHFLVHPLDTPSHTPSHTPTQHMPLPPPFLSPPLLDLFAKGMRVLMDKGTPLEECRVIAAFGSIILDQPLQFAHPTGATIGELPLTHHNTLLSLTLTCPNLNLNHNLTQPYHSPP